MPLLMVKPTWPASGFQRTVVVERDKKKKPTKTKVFKFSKTDPVEVTAEELELLKSDIGNSIFEVEIDPKNRVRYLEPKQAQADQESPSPAPTE